LDLDYRYYKMLHVLGAVLFVGNLAVTALWKSLADRSGDGRVVAFAQRMVTLTDFAFTGPGAGLVLATGLVMAPTFDERFWTVSWIGWGLALFGLSGLIWLMVLIPLQVRQAQLAREFASGGEIPERYRRLSRLWMVWGCVATLLPLCNLYLMVLRP